MRFTLKTISMIFINLLLVYFLASCSKKTNTIAIGKSTIDSDSDGITDDQDNCLNSVNPLQEDADTDGVGDICDNCIDKINQDQADDDGDGIGNACEDSSGDGDDDKDKDGVPDESDNCPEISNVNQEDEDLDSIGDVCDSCDDRIDFNNDGIGDICEVKSWVHPTNINNYISPINSNAIPSGYYSSNVGVPRVAMDNIGNTIVVWQQLNENNIFRIFMSEYRNGAWKNPDTLDKHILPLGSHASSPQVAMDNNGNAIIVWSQMVSNNIYRIFKSEYRNHIWDHPSGLDDSIPSAGITASSPQVAMSDNGDAIIVWSERIDDENIKIYKSEYRNSNWTTTSDLTNALTTNTSTYLSTEVQYSNFPQIAMDDEGNTIIIWRQSYDDYPYRLFKSEYKGGSWTHPSKMSDSISPYGNDVFYPSVKIGNDGSAIIAWVQNDGTNNRIYKSEYRGGSWIKPYSLDDGHISPVGQNANAPDIAIDGKGNAIIVWSQKHSSTESKIYMSEYRGLTWLGPSTIDNFISLPGTSAVSPQVSMDDNGNAMIVWNQDNGSEYQIYKNEFRNGHWVKPDDLTESISLAGQSAVAPDLAMDNNNNALIVWSQYDGSKYQIFKSEYR